MTPLTTRTAARVVELEFAALRSSRSTLTTWHSMSRSRTEASPRQTVQCSATQRFPRVGWNTASWYVVSSKRIWGTRADAVGTECLSEDPIF